MIKIPKREAFRKRVENLIPQIEKSEIVQHSAKEGIARQTIYDAKNRLANRPRVHVLARFSEFSLVWRHG